MKKLKSQSGRSMVEMLGVLAIIGVLSVGGIAGYSLSMRRHRANQIVDIASKYALTIYNQCQQHLLNTNGTTVDDCVGQANISYFDEAGLSLPAGVTGAASPLFSVDATSGADVVHVYLSVPDQKLCQAVASIAGSACGQESNLNIVPISIKQN